MKDACILDCMCVWLCATVGSQMLQKVAESLNSKRLTHVHVHVVVYMYMCNDIALSFSVQDN